MLPRLEDRVAMKAQVGIVMATEIRFMTVASSDGDVLGFVQHGSCEASFVVLRALPIAFVLLLAHRVHGVRVTFAYQPRPAFLCYPDLVGFVGISFEE